MNKKKIVIIILVIAVLLIVIGLGIYFNDNNSSTNNDNTSGEVNMMPEEDARNYIGKLTDAIIYGGTREELEDALKTDQIIDSDIMTGEDMYLRQKPSDNIIEEYSLDEYVSAANTLADNLEKTIQDNFEYTINSISGDDEYTSADISYRTFYYYAYLVDLAQIQTELLIRAGYNLDNATDSEELQVDIYKAKIKAASLLDSHLDNYINSDEVNNTIVSYVNNNIEDSSEEFMSYFINLTGFPYEFHGNLTTEEAVNEFLNDYDLTDPLAI